MSILTHIAPAATVCIVYLCCLQLLPPSCSAALMTAAQSDESMTTHVPHAPTSMIVRWNWVQALASGNAQAVAQALAQASSSADVSMSCSCARSFGCDCADLVMISFTTRIAAPLLLLPPYLDAAARMLSVSRGHRGCVQLHQGASVLPLHMIHSCLHALMTCDAAPCP